MNCKSVSNQLGAVHDRLGVFAPLMGRLGHLCSTAIGQGDYRALSALRKVAHRVFMWYFLARHAN